jgi:hypothetical protein
VEALTGLTGEEEHEGGREQLRERRRRLERDTLHGKIAAVDAEKNAQGVRTASGFAEV